MAYGMNRPRDAFFHKQNQLTEAEEKRLFDNAMRALEAQIMSIGMHLSIDADARFAYSREIAKMSSELQSQVRRGKISWQGAAVEANEMRNKIMNILRHQSTPVGRAISESLKPKGKDLNSIVKNNTVTLFGEQADFYKLSLSQQNQVYAASVKSAGRPRDTISNAMHVAGPAGCGLIILSLALSVYTIATAESKLQAAGKEAVITGAGVGGAFYGGAFAGLACGPGAPLCVSVGTFIGGALAALGANFFW